MPALEVLEVPPGPAGLVRVLPALRSALDGSGPAIGLTPAGSSAAELAVRSALRASEPIAADTAVVIATSGSTGAPAAVELSAAALCSAADGLADLVGGGRRWLASLPLHSVGGLMTVVRSLRAGAEPIAGQWLGGASSFGGADFQTATRQLLGAGPVKEVGGHAVSLVPAMLARLLTGGSGCLEALRHYDLVLVGGAAAPAGQLAAARAQGVAVVASYGMTETCGGVVFDGVSVPTARVSAPAGRLRISGPMVARGYRDGRTPELFGLTPAGVPTFLTNDLGAIDAHGLIDVRGRVDDVVAVGGGNVSLMAVERILGLHAGGAAVVAVPDQTWGARIVAFLVTPQMPQEALATVVRDRLGAAAVPREWRVLPTLPLLSGGKTDRRQLTKWATPPA